jgi:hypothetical protein
MMAMTVRVCLLLTGTLVAAPAAAQAPGPAPQEATVRRPQDPVRPYPYRDYTVLGHRCFLVLADHLTRRGIAVLRVDDRGLR